MKKERLEFVGSIHFNRRLLVVFALFLLCMTYSPKYMSTQAKELSDSQETEHTQQIFAGCEFDAQDVFWRLGRRDRRLELVPAIDQDVLMQTLLDWRGENTWGGYDGGDFNFPEDAVSDGTIFIRNVQELDDQQQIWIYWSESTQKYYLLPFDNMKEHSDSNGDHLGVHPCGSWKVDAETIDDFRALFKESNSNS